MEQNKIKIEIFTEWNSALIEHDAMGAPGKTYHLCSDLASLIEEALTLVKKNETVSEVKLKHGKSSVLVIPYNITGEIDESGDAI